MVIDKEIAGEKMVVCYTIIVYHVMLTFLNSSGNWQASFVPHSADLLLCQALFTATSRPGTVFL